MIKTAFLRHFQSPYINKFLVTKSVHQYYGNWGNGRKGDRVPRPLSETDVVKNLTQV